MAEQARALEQQIESVSPRPHNTGMRTAIAILFVCALSIRLLYLYESADNPTFLYPIIDSKDYDQAARDFVAGEPWNEYSFFEPFSYPFFLCILYWISGCSILFAKLVQAVIGSGTCVLTCLLGCKVFGRKTGLAAGAITAVYGPLIFYDGELLAASLAAFGSVALMLLFLKAVETPSIPRFVALGLCGALVGTTRSEVLPVFGVTCLWLLFQWRHERGPAYKVIDARGPAYKVIDARGPAYKVIDARGKHAIASRVIAIAVGFAIVVLPVAYLCQETTGRFTFLPSCSGLNFYLGNNADPCATVTIRPGKNWDDLARAAETQGYHGLWEHQRYFYAKLGDYIVEQPVGFMTGLLKKSVEFVNSREIPRNLDIYLFREWSSILSVTVWKWGRFGFPFGILFPFVVYGAFRKWRQIPRPIQFFVILYPLAIIVVFVSGRYRAPTIPVFAVLAAAGVLSGGTPNAHTGAARGKPRATRLFRWIAPLAAIMTFAVSAIPGPFCQETVDLQRELWFLVARAHERRGENIEAIERYQKTVQIDPDYFNALYRLSRILKDLNRPEEALPYLEHAARLEPNDTIVQSDYGEILGKLGRYEEALPHLHRAIELDPNNAPAHNNLGIVLVQTKKLAEAAKHFRRAFELKPESENIRRNFEQVQRDLQAQEN